MGNSDLNRFAVASENRRCSRIVVNFPDACPSLRNDVISDNDAVDKSRRAHRQRAGYSTDNPTSCPPSAISRDRIPYFLIRLARHDRRDGESFCTCDDPPWNWMVAGSSGKRYRHSFTWRPVPATRSRAYADTCIPPGSTCTSIDRQFLYRVDHFSIQTFFFPAAFLYRYFASVTFRVLPFRCPSFM